MRMPLVMATVFVALLVAACVGTREPLPKLVQEVRITARQFEFTPDRVAVKAGQPVRLIITSADVDHQLAITGMEIGKYAIQGRVHILEFIPTRTGSYEFRCAIMCGAGHDYMKGVLVVE